MRYAPIAVAVLVVAMGGCAFATAVETPKPLRDVSVFDPEPLPTATVPQGGEPGENELLPRGFAGAVPQIPHAVASFAITIDGNDCLGCHLPENAEGVAPAAPPTHMTGKALASARYNCTQCHVTRTGAKALVKNGNDRFVVPAVPAP
jgi:nitrate reductase cytochrome c-type subunit